MNDVLAGLTEEQVTRLRELIAEVLRVNQQFNLTSVRDADEAWIKHILDSLQGLGTGLFEGAPRVIDIGAGAGFPGLPLAIARPDLKLTSLEVTRKKADFIAATSVKFGLRAQVLNERAETVGQDKNYRGKFDVATVRAVGAVAEVCELALPLVHVGGHVVLWRGSRGPEELAAAQTAVRRLGGTSREVTAYNLPGHDMQYHLITLAKTGPTPREFPRRVGVPKQQPL